MTGISGIPWESGGMGTNVAGLPLTWGGKRNKETRRALSRAHTCTRAQQSPVKQTSGKAYPVLRGKTRPQPNRITVLMCVRLKDKSNPSPNVT